MEDTARDIGSRLQELLKLESFDDLLELLNILNKLANSHDVNILTSS